MSPNVMVGIATNRERTIQAGSLVQIDSRGRPLQVGILESMPGPGRTSLTCTAMRSPCHSTRNCSNSAHACACV